MSAVSDHAINVVTDGRGPAVGTVSGGLFHFLMPVREEVNIIDIAHALSNQCRFVGHTKTFYSVAQHSLHVSKLVPEYAALQGLLHDAAEAYIGDLSRPLKLFLESIGVEAVNTLEDRIMSTIMGSLGQSYPVSTTVKVADNVALATERRDVLAPVMSQWVEGLPDPDPERIVALSPAEAKAAFLARYIELREAL